MTPVRLHDGMGGQGWEEFWSMQRPVDVSQENVDCSTSHVYDPKAESREHWTPQGQSRRTSRLVQDRIPHSVPKRFLTDRKEWFASIVRRTCT